MHRVRRLDPLDAAGLLVATSWLGWVLIAAGWSARPVPWGGPYLTAPLTGLAGVAVGRVAAARARVWPVGEVLLAAVGVFLVAYLRRGGAAALPLGYSNANAAAGIQLLALAVLAGLWARDEPSDALVPFDVAVPPRTRRVRLAVLAGAAAVAVIARNDSVAGWALLIPVLAAGLWLRLHARGPWRAFTAVMALGTIGAAAAANLHLAGRATWPTPLLRALDAARKQLWSDALALWRAHPVAGGGPGSFREASRLAADPDTATVHSSLLQVGSELGIVGVALFGALVCVGLALALRRRRAAGLIAAAAWTALVVHSFVDHLFEFTAVTVAAGAVLGWASAARPANADTPSIRPNSTRSPEFRRIDGVSRPGP